MEQYPAIRFMVDHGSKLAWLVALSIPALALLGVMVVNWHWLWLLVALLTGALAGVVFRTMAELTQVIAEMLLRNLHHPRSPDLPPDRFQTRGTRLASL